MVGFKHRVRQLTRRSGNSQSLSDIAERLRSYLLGWKAYFGLAQTPRDLASAGRMASPSARAIQLKQWKRARPNIGVAGTGHLKTWQADCSQRA